MPIFTEAPDCKFAFVAVAGKRSRQLMLGAPPRLANPHSHKATRVAMEELTAGLLEYRTPEPKSATALAPESKAGLDREKLGK